MRLLSTRSRFRRCVHCAVDDTRTSLRALLRETAQSVAVLTALLPATSTPAYHGATLSSFTSVALDPFPLVAFSLRVPSRMASALNAHVASSPAPHTPHFVANILSAAQPHLADRFARPDLHPRPFADPHVPWTLSQQGVPILSGALGAISCRLVGPSLPLAHPHGVRAFEDQLEPGVANQGARNAEGETQRVSGAMGLLSELFIARVLRVECVPSVEDGVGLHKLPLLYHRRRYTTVRDHRES